MAEENSGELFSFTRSSSLNSLIEEAKKIYEDDFDPEFFIDEYRENLQKFKELSEALREFHGNLRKIQEDVPAITEQSDIIKTSIDQIFPGVRLMEEYLEYREKEKILEGLSVVRAANEAIFNAVDRISQEEAKLEKYSASPYVHELIRVARGVLDKGFPREALKEKLDWMLNDSEGVFRDFSVYKTAKFETMAIQEKVSEMDAALEKYRAGLREIENYFSDEDPVHIEKGTQILKEGSDALIEAHKLIQSELAGSASKFCVKCGEENDLTDKFCCKCSALLPEAQQAAADSSVDVRVTSGGVEDRVLTSNIIRLTEAVNEYCEGRSSEQELLKVIEWMEEKVQAGIGMLQNMPSPDQCENESQRDELATTAALLEEGTYELESAIATLKSFFGDGEVQHLREGLAAAQDAAYKLFQVQERSKFAVEGT